MKRKTLQLKRALRSVLLVLLLSEVGMGKMDAQNLIVNGDFEQTSGFDYQTISDYTRIWSGGVGVGQFIHAQTTTGHSPGGLGWPSNLLGYGGTGYYLLFNGFGGSINPTKAVWRQTVAVTANTTYTFSAQVRNLAQGYLGMNPNLAIMRLKINNQQVGTDLTLPTNNYWNTWTITWNSGSSTQAVIEIFDVYDGDPGFGDDFGLDHIFFAPEAVYSVTANNDVWPLVCYGTSTEIPVLVNDIISPGLQNITVQILGQPSHGEAYYLSSNHKIEYICTDNSFSGTDSFQYRVGFPAQNIFDEAWVYVTVGHAPIVANITAQGPICAGGALNIPTPSVNPSTAGQWEKSTAQNGTFTSFDPNNIPLSMNGNWVRYSASNDCGEGHSNAVQITVYQDDNNITFADANVKAICVANWDTNGDGELSYDEAAAVTDLGNVFRENSTITSFNELQYFTGLSSIGNYAFSCCYGLTAITLPNSVVSIGDLAFHLCRNLASIILPDLVTSIGDSAFDDCYSLTSLILPNSVTSIGNFAFSFCYGLTSMTIPSSVTSIGYGLFYCCSSLGQIVVETGNAFYDSRENCNAIINTSTNELVAGCKNTIIPNTAISIGKSAFDGCFGLTSIIIPNTITSIGDFAFRYCYGLTSFNIPNSVTSIGMYAFENCNNLISIVIPNSVASIGNLAFRGCSSFEQIVVEQGNTVYDSRENSNAIIETSSNELMVGCKNTIIPNSVSSIGYYAFLYCTNLISIIIPDSVTTIGDYAFNGCSGLTSMTVLAETPPALGSDAFYDVNTSIPVYVPCSSLSAYQSAVGWNEFTNYMPATTCASGEITVTANPTEGGTVTGAGYYEGGVTCTLTATPNESFSFLNWMENGVIVSNDTVYSFIVSGDRDLVANFAEEGDVCTLTFDLFDSYGDGYTGNYLVVTDENGFSQQLTVESGSSAVYTLPFLTGSHITLTWIFGSYPEDCSFTVSYSNGNVIYHGENLSSSFSYEFDVDCSFAPIENIVFADANVKAICVANWDTNGDGELSYDEAAAVTDLGQVFMENTGITSFEELQYFTGLTTIAEYAFDNCSNLSGSLYIPNSVTSIGYFAFCNCSGLTGSLTIPNSVTSIGDNAFYGCSGFSGNLTIPSSVIEIATNLEMVNPFSGCIGIEQIMVDINNPNYDSRENCNAIIETSTNKLVSGCKNSVIPDGVTTIGNGAFFGYNDFTSSLTIPNSVTTIGNWAFYGCSSLTGDLVIPNSVTTIGNWAFYGCSSLTGDLVIPNSVTTIGNYAFNNCNDFSGMMMFGTIPLTLGYGVFDYSDFPIYVPYESLNDYKTATNWSYYEDRIFPMAYTTVAGYYEGEGNYRFIASPLVENTDPTAVDNMITETAYDLYRFDQSEDAEWQNYKFPENTPNFFLNNGQGYLYANAEDVNLIFKGEFNEDDTKEVGLAYDANAELAGWNLVGNPFPVNAYANKSYYTINEEGTAVEPNMVSSATAIPACTGVMVMAEAEGETVVFSTDTPEAATNQGCLQIALAQTTTRGNAIQDKAIVSFNAVDRLEKFVFNKEKAVISIPQGGKELSIACTDKQGEMPLNFKATKNGEYTLTIHSEAVELDYLHLIDNLTGADVDLQVSPAYTYAAKTTDYASRFRLVFSGKEADCPSTGSETFAFVNNGNIIITGAEADAVLQIVDITGRIIVDTDVSRNISTNGMTSGVYVLRLIDGDKVRTQKIVME